MTRVELTGATAPLAEYARKASRGPVLLTRRGRPVALLRVLTAAEREDLAVSTHAGFIDLIARSRKECPPGTGLSLQSVEKQLGIAAVKARRKRTARRQR
jgi:hypothetical protein